MSERAVLIANLGSNLVAVLMLLACRRWPRVGRGLFFALFLWASQVNLRFALTRPEIYLDYAQWAIGPYRRFILGPFARHAAEIVATIALGQLAIAVLVALRGRAVKLGLAGAIVFLLAIAPLGRGSVFPFSLIVSAAALLVMRQPIETTLPADLVALARRRRA
jgi:hypothetical protein